MKRLLGADLIESDFKTAVFRFTDDTAKQFGPVTRDAGVVNERAQKLAREMDERTLRETGANLSARLAISLLNLKKPGFFFANFAGGKRGNFSVVLDHQNRIPVANFRIDAGEKGIIWSYDSGLYYSHVWLAFLALEDYQRGTVTAHQWWGNIVYWRFYLDQWLSEGFAEYSGIHCTRSAVIATMW